MIHVWGSWSAIMCGWLSPMMSSSHFKRLLYPINHRRGRSWCTSFVGAEKGMCPCASGSSLIKPDRQRMPYSSQELISFTLGALLNHLRDNYTNPWLRLFGAELLQRIAQSHPSLEVDVDVSDFRHMDWVASELRSFTPSSFQQIEMELNNNCLLKCDLITMSPPKIAAKHGKLGD